MHYRILNFPLINTKVKYVIAYNKSKNLYNLYLFNDRFYLLLNLPERILLCEKETSVLSITPVISTYQLLGIKSPLPRLGRFINSLTELLYTWDTYYFKKLLIDGKAYRITKFKGNNLKLMFGRSHRCILFYKNTFLKKKKKN
jgi:hypothetical protein